MDPLQTLRVCHKLLRPGGCLVLSTPDASALLARLLGRNWLGFRSVGEHVYFFGRDTIRSYLAKAGFDVLKLVSVGKYLPLGRFVTRLHFYTRLFNIMLPEITGGPARLSLYVNPGDTMCVVARKQTIDN